MRTLYRFLALLLITAWTTVLQAEDVFTIIAVPDTQQEVLRANDTRFVNRIQWVLNHRTELNIKCFIQVGDLCNWDTPDHIQYQRASAGLKLLDDAKLPYVLTIGNHDTAATKEGGSAAPGNVHDNQRNTTTFNSFFPVSRHQIVKGTYEPNKIDNAWHEFTAGGLNWIVIDVELWPRAGAVAWVKSVLAAHPHHNGIISTHNYLNGDRQGSPTNGYNTINQTNGGYGDNSSQYLWDNALRDSPNMRLTVSGHVGTHGYRVDTGTGGNKVYSFLQNYADNENNQTRVLTINTKTGTIVSSMHDPIKGDGVVLNDGSSFTVTGVSWVQPAAPVNVAPSITTQPTSKTVTAGQTATFSVAASGTPTPTFQWQKNNANISGATSASYTTPATTTGDSGATYRCIASNSAGSATSNSATLTVNAATVAPAITTQPTSKSVTVGQTATFTVAASGTPAPTFQWQKNNANISGATSVSYTTPATVAGDNGATYRCIASNSAGSATSTSATLTVAVNPVVGTGTGLSGAYFGNQDLTGTNVLRKDATVNFTWAEADAPVAGIGAGTYSIRWAGQVQAQYSQTYTFSVTADDGVRLWVNGQKLVDQWKDQAATEYSGTIAMTAGSKYDIALEYYQAAGGARIALAWSSASTAKQIIPTSQLYPAGVTAPWGALPMGTGTQAGSGYVSGDTVVLTGAGGDIFKDTDGGQLFTQPLSGDGTIVTRVVSLTNTNPWAKAGVMIREGTGAGAKHAFCFITPGNGVGFIRRTATNGMSTYTAGSKSAVARWLKLARTGSTITASESADGAAWTVVGTVSVSLANPVQIGFAVTSGDNSKLCTAVFDLVQITPSGNG